MGITFLGVVALMVVITWRAPMDVARIMPQNSKMDMRSSRSAKWGGIAVVLIILTLYAVFW